VARSRYRSVRYDLEAAVAVARIVANAGGTIAPDLLAVALGYSGTNNGTYLTRLANARLFGVVGGRGLRVDLTDRGRQILAGIEPRSSGARREAFMAVPLFRAVFELWPTTPLEGRPQLADLLCQDFGEQPDKALLAAGKLLDSAVQAEIVRVRSDGKYEVKRSARSFTVVDNFRPSSLRALVVKSRSTQPDGRSRRFRPMRGGDMDESNLWLAEEPRGAEKGLARPNGRRRAGVVAAAVACLIIVVVPVSVALTGGTTHSSAHASKHHQTGSKPIALGKGPAEHEVLGALSATTDSGSFDFTYHLSTTPPTGTVPTTTTTTECHAVAAGSPPVGTTGVTSSAGFSGAVEVVGGSRTTPKKVKSGQLSAPALPGTTPGTTQTVTECSGGGPVENPGTPVAGTGVSNVNPKATLVDANVGTGASGGSGLTVSLRVDSTTLYEDLSNLETSLAPPPSMENASGQPISGFAGITESTIGMREGAIAMIGLASPTGYLDLYQQDINGASQTGTSTVNGAPVTQYQVAVDPTQLVNDPGITSEESQTAAAAITVLKNEGYTGTTDEVSIDGSGFIREVRSVARFSDGGTVVLDVVLSNFGCAGTVLMPGQQGSSTPPSGCTSPDTGAPTTTPSTTVPAVTGLAPKTTTTTTTTTEVPTTVVPTTVAPTTSTTAVQSTTSTTGS
jgi:hypothetical protein